MTGQHISFKSRRKSSPAGLVAGPQAPADRAAGGVAAAPADAFRAANRQAVQMAAGRSVIKEISMAKNFATDIADRLTYDAVQIMGGMGYMRESLVERLYRDNRILSIGGGTREIMNEIIAKQMGL